MRGPFVRIVPKTKTKISKETSHNVMKLDTIRDFVVKLYFLMPSDSQR